MSRNFLQAASIVLLAITFSWSNARGQGSPETQQSLGQKQDKIQWQESPRVENHEITIDFTQRQQITFEKEALGIEESIKKNLSPVAIHFVSAKIKVPLQSAEPFLAIASAWRNAGEAENRFVVSLRGSVDGNAWGEWNEISVDEHTISVEGETFGNLIFLDKMTQHIQYRLTLPAMVSTIASQITRLRLSFISPGETPPQVLGQIKKVNSSGNRLQAPMPTYISRTGWGCPEGQASPRWLPTQTSATHLIIHHTAGSNTSTDWPAVMRSIWAQHANTNAWGDIGYNWLIDPNGVIYQGRAWWQNADDNVRGGHFCGVSPDPNGINNNEQTMGVALIGTFISVSPTTNALNSLKNLLAWKCSQRSLDPIGTTLHAPTGLSLKTLSGHQDGCATQCPGDNLYAQLPAIRNDVKNLVTPIVKITFATVPAGLQILVDGILHTTPKTFDWPEKEVHVVTAISPQDGPIGTRYNFTAWNDGSTQSPRIFTTPSTNTAYTANFATQYQLTVNATPVAGGTTTPSGTSWRNSGEVVPITATPNTNYNFAGWSGNAAGTNNPLTVSMEVPKIVTANFIATPPPGKVVIATNPSGLEISVDGITYTAPKEFQWQQSSQHTLEVKSPQNGETGTRYVFSNWSDGGAQKHTITVPATPMTYTANFATQYLLTAIIQTNPYGPVSGSVGFFPSGPSGDCIGVPESPVSCFWYNSGQNVQLTATFGSGYLFNGWIGSGTVSYTGPNNPASVTMNGPITETANFYQPPPEIFTEVSNALPNATSGQISWGDYDNDQDLDILLTGSGFAKIYRNDSAGFSEIPTSLPGVSASASAWGDYDNDGDLDILLTGNATPLTKIYRNNGGGNFSETPTALTGVWYGAVAWGDYDNDGDLDILLTGQSFSVSPYLNIAKIYRNDGGGLFTDVAAALVGVANSAVAWGDYDNDGDLDIALTGSGMSFSTISKIYRNDAGTFKDIQAPLTPITSGSVAWGDCDNDGDLDLLLTGNAMPGRITELYKNNNGSFVETATPMAGVYNSSTAWGDYDNDGDLDVLLAGIDSSSVPISKVYQNAGGNFNEFPASLTGVYFGTIAWGDYNNDRKLDILLSGRTASDDRIAKLYRNNIGAANTNPATPAGLAAGVSGNSVTLSWNKASDGQTAQNALTYNLRVGTTPGGAQTASPMANSSGYRKVVKLGNTNHRNSWTLKNLPSGKYYWSAQAIDNAFAGSAFAAEQSFTIAPESFTDISAPLTGVSGSALAWGDYDNDNDLDVLLTGQTVSGTPITKIYRNDKSNFVDIKASLPGVYNGAAAWGDFDNDNDLDILLTGYTGATRITKIYKNNGGSFIEHPTSLIGVTGNAVAWGDYDNDGDLDILLAGSNGSKAVAKVYRNDGGTFTDIAAPLAQVQDGAALWGDYDSDGDLDILLTGAPDSGSPIAKIYRNDQGNFVDTQASLTGVRNSSAAWGDYNHDGKLDILLIGDTGRGRVAKIYRNIGGDKFEEPSTPLMGVMGGSVAWGDYDNDGDLDILLTGYNSTPARVSKVYRNDNGNFVEIDAALIGVNVSSAVWGDYDNDGDLDILLAGANEDNSAVAKIYRNTISKRNTAPVAPNGLTAAVKGNTATLSWNKATDVQTVQNALTYNLRLGARSNGLGKLSPMSSLINGYRRIPKLGNANHRNSWTIKNLPAGKYYWNVQAIDNAFAGSAFAGEQSFTIAPDTVTLPAVAAYGNIPGGDEAHADKMVYSFSGRAGHAFLSYQVYDIDAKDEAAIFLNGAKIGNVPVTADNKWSGNLELFLPDELVNNAGLNAVVFDNAKNPPSGLIWGVRQVSVSAADCFALPALPAYGKLPLPGGQAHADRVIYCFPGQPGNLSLAYEVYDIDDIHEVDILLNGKKIRDEAITANAGWSGKRTLPLLDADVNDNVTNVLIFDNTKNPNPTWLWDWGVRNVSVAPALTKNDSLSAMAAPKTGWPIRYELVQNFPNPFNPSTTINFALPVSGKVKLTVYNLNGELIRTLVARIMPAGNHEVIFNAGGMASGTYYYRLEAGAFTATRTMTLTK